MKKILLIIGTRPEAIKMAPVFKLLQKDPFFNCRLCLSGQHRELMEDVLDFFRIRADYNLAVMEESEGDLTFLTATILTKVKNVLKDFHPDCVLVQGDTTTAFAASLSAFYEKIKIVHIEAGLRTFDKDNPFPEEFNRTAISRLADYHLAPTETARHHLIQEKIPCENIFVTGNTVVDALLEAKKIVLNVPPFLDTGGRKILLTTIHRRENHGDIFEGICAALLELSKREDWLIVFPVHPNSHIHPVAHLLLGCRLNIKLLEPQPYGHFIQLMSQSDLILTDSGGIQEEATVLNKPVLVVRQVTERPEAVRTGIVKVVGNVKERLIYEVGQWMDDLPRCFYGGGVSSPYGDGQASQKIIGFLKELLGSGHV